ncbi:MAG: hypothetical protein IT373_13315 [Polyangiaceae bacterium]|nr:hypothetical protein [Polyangiaceae bacterium]
MSEPGRCESCAAFFGARTDERLGKVGTCALEIYAPPVRASATCARYRPKGTAAPPPRPRVPGEPRGHRSHATHRSSAAPAPAPTGVRAADRAPPLPQEIDIDMDIEEFRRVLREVIADELGVSRAPLGPRWQGGELVLKPGKADTQDKRVPIESFFHKIVMVRDKLRLLEAKLNAHPGLSDEDKVQLQSYITGCYGSLTTFNVLFADKGDQFVGQAQG